MTTDLTTTGVWYFTDGFSASEAADVAGRIEALGYSTLWIPETVGRDPFAHAAYLLSQTSSLALATGIANIFLRHPGAMVQAANTVAEASGGRFVLGMGVSHQPLVEGLRKLDWSKPLSQLRTYLDGMDQSPYSAARPEPAPPRVIGALGPNALALAAERTDGAHPYWTTPEHTAQARQIMGPDALLCVEQKLVLETDPARAREAAAGALGMYASLPNYRNNWKRLGYTDDDIDQREPRFIDAVVGWGDADAIRRRVQEHYDAGATHVCVQPVSLPGSDAAIDWRVLEACAPVS